MESDWFKAAHPLKLLVLQYSMASSICWCLIFIAPQLTVACAILLCLCQAGNGVPHDEFPEDSLTVGDTAAAILCENFGLTIYLMTKLQNRENKLHQI